MLRTAGDYPTDVTGSPLSVEDAANQTMRAESTLSPTLHPYRPLERGGQWRAVPVPLRRYGLLTTYTAPEAPLVIPRPKPSASTQPWVGPAQKPRGAVS